VFTFQRKRGAFVVIEGGGLPFGRIVAVFAIGHFVGEELGELPGMHVFMALLAPLRSFLEVHVRQPGLHILWLVAVDAGHRAMCALQRE